MTKILSVVALVLCALAARASFAARPLSMQDVAALASGKSWSELLTSAVNVPPAARTPTWATFVTQAAAGRLQELVEQPSDGTRANEIVQLVTTSEAKYSHLVHDTTYLKAKSSALAALVGFCAQTRAYGCGDALEALSHGVDPLPKGSAQKIALLLGDEGRFPSETLRFWAAAAAEDAGSCKFGGLQSGVLNALASNSADATQRSGVEAATNVVKACYQPMEDALIGQLSSAAKGSTYAIRVCPILKAHSKSTMAIRDKCS